MPKAVRIRTVRDTVGQGPVRAAAYGGRRRLYDETHGRTYDFSRRPGLAWSELSLPAGAGPAARDAEEFWNRWGRAGRGGRSGYTLIVVLPPALPLSAQVHGVRAALHESVVAGGHAADWHIHHDRPGNPHAHVLVSALTLDRNGAWVCPATGAARAALAGLRARLEAWACAPSEPRPPGDHHMRNGEMSRTAQGRAAAQALRPWPPSPPCGNWLRPRDREYPASAPLSRGR